MGAPTHAAAFNKADNILCPASLGTMLDDVGCSCVSSDEETEDATSTSSKSLKLLDAETISFGDALENALCVLLVAETISFGDALENALCILLKSCATSSHSSGS